MGCATSSTSASAAKHWRGTGSFRSRYDVKDKLGVGSFAQVRLGLNKTTNTEHAIKIVRTPTEKEITKSARELEVWSQVGTHAHVVALLESYVEPSVTYFVMERCQGSVFDVLKQNESGFRTGDLLDATHQVFLGLAHCHSKNVVHRDIKAANLLVDSEGVVKICDFGLSLIMPEGGVYGIVGSAPYMSPEMVKGRNYGFGTDIWSCAAVLYFLIFQQYPYDAALGVKGHERKKEMMKSIATDSPKPAFTPASNTPPPTKTVQELIQKLLQRKVEERPNAEVSARLVLDAKSVLRVTECDSPVAQSEFVNEYDDHVSDTLKALSKPHKELENSSDSTRDTNTVISGQTCPGSSCRLSSNIPRDESRYWHL